MPKAEKVETGTVVRTVRANRGAAKRQPWNGDDVQRLAEEFLSMHDVAAALGTSSNVIQTRFKGRWVQGHAVALTKLRAAQWRLAMQGNAPMLIWLGKQYLGQRDVQAAKGKQTSEIQQTVNVGISIKEACRLAPNELIRMYRAALVSSADSGSESEIAEGDPVTVHRGRPVLGE